ncbi:LamB/YcsF family protein, partial [Tepidimonas sp.]|uniref:LamB/YcsF family protein n=1 Tax=Tepidimonas sp. TaxID=2002775 RepID=UPI002FE1E9A1
HTALRQQHNALQRWMATLRTYQRDGQLTPRREPGAVLHDADACIEHVLRMLEAGGLVTREGHVLPTPIDSICVHGDGPHAVATARQLRLSLQAAGWAAAAARGAAVA